MTLELFHLKQLASDIPDREQLLNEALLLQLQSTRAAAELLDLDRANGNAIKLASEQASKLVSLLLTIEANRSVAPEDTQAEGLDFSLEPVEYTSKDDLQEYL